MPFAGERHPKAKLTDKQIQHLRRLWSNGYTANQLSEWFGISRTYAYLLATEKVRVQKPKVKP